MKTNIFTIGKIKRQSKVALFDQGASFVAVTLGLLLILNALVTVSMGLFSLVGLQMSIIRGALILSFVIISLAKVKLNATGKMIVLFLTYLLILCLFSSDIRNSLWIYLKFALPLLLFPIASFYITQWKQFKIITLSCIIMCFILIFGFFLSNIFGLGQLAYNMQGGVYLGGLEVQFTHVLVYGFLTLPLSITLFRLKKYKIMVASILLIGGIIPFLVLKRSSIIAIVLGFGTYFLVSNNTKYKLKILYIIGWVLIIFMSYYLIDFNTNLENILKKRFDIQVELASRGGRADETAIVISDFLNGSMPQRLFGRELFNSESFLRYEMHIPKNRMLHVDYNILLDGAGIVGLLGYFLIFLFIIKQFSRIIRRIPNQKFRKECNAIFYSLLMSSFILSSSTQIWSIDSLSFLFVYLGSLTGALDVLGKQTVSHQLSQQLVRGPGIFLS